jgi:hypothetical protein
MGFEDEVEQSFGRPCRQTDGYATVFLKRTARATVVLATATFALAVATIILVVSTYATAVRH